MSALNSTVGIWIGRSKKCNCRHITKSKDESVDGVNECVYVCETERCRRTEQVSDRVR